MFSSFEIGMEFNVYNIGFWNWICIDLQNMNFILIQIFYG